MIIVELGGSVNGAVIMNEPQNSKIKSKALSAKAVEGMKPGDKVKADIEENSGLRVNCGKGGTKTFFYRYRSPEVESLVQIKIGNFPDISLSEARVELQKLKAMRRQGICPKAESIRNKNKLAQIKEQELIQQEENSFSVEELVELYLTESIEDRVIDGKKIRGARKPKGQAEARRTLTVDVINVIGDTPAAKLTRNDVINLIKGIIQTRGANVQAGNVLRELSAAYEYAIGIGKLPCDFANPAFLAKAGLRQAKVKLTPNKGRRVLSDKELSLMLEWLPGSGLSTTQKNVLRMALWTGCRSGEVCRAEWVDIDLNKATWHMRDSKNDAERHVQLSDQLVNFLKQLKLTTKTYVFPSTKTGKPIQQKSISETKWQLQHPSRVKNGRRLKMNQKWITTIDDWSPHDLRRTVRSGLSKLGCRSEVAEAILGHSRKGIEGTYDLYNYEKECKIWLQKWADHLDELILKHAEGQ